MNSKSTILFLLLGPMFFLSACSPKPYAASEKLYKQQLKAYIKTLKQMKPTPIDSDPASSLWVPTTNFNLRKPNYVILHHTAQDSVAQTLKTFTLQKSQVSAHYVVAKDGKVYHMLNDYLRAWHAGVAKWGNNTDINSMSIGIELDNNGAQPFTDAQINSLLLLLKTLKKTYNIPTSNFIGHADIAPKRKPDPNEFFPWKTLAEKGYGLWYDKVLETPPAEFNPFEALHVIGYDTSDINAALVAFKRHFIQNDLRPIVTESDKAILYNLYKKY
ncbi:N-acetylmuramoyl-L-alanine amidase [Solitalea koreensis]|uniref:N-acetylmuramoyl-L-alanine amidase n=1 Tax=Solitalea koreensis TaxID=543615 RepID=A0A521BXF6_9SPHI|nr:N-acetylmuramoyl-L-alanine amidase [Solitalea koreensis]SMO51884.1 N-acetylmuramoyl-L-alanine amidase [Solitalea koreensis]